MTKPATRTSRASGVNGFQVSQRAGVQLHSRRIADGYRLVLTTRSRTRVIALPLASAPLQVDLGTDTNDRTVGVFTACAKTTCTLHKIDPRTATISRLPVSRSCRPDHPTVHDGVVTYACRRGPLTRLYTTRRTSPNATKLTATIPGRVEGLDASSAGLTYVSVASVGDAAHAPTVLRLRSPAGATRTIAKGDAGEEGGTTIVSPTLAGPYVFWGTTEGEPARGFRGQVHRLDRRTGRHDVLDSPGAALFSVSSDSATPLAAVLADYDTGGPEGYDPSYSRQVLRRLLVERFHQPG